MNYSAINTYDIANGPGFRVSLFVSGCRNACEGCFNHQSWDFGYGEPFGDRAKERIFSALSDDTITGITLLGGEPLEPENQPCILELVREIRQKFPGKTIWLYTGRTLHIENGKFAASSNFMVNDIANTDILNAILSLCDVVVDGPFISRLKSTTAFRGSMNQRTIDIKSSINGDRIVLWHPPEIKIKIV